MELPSASLLDIKVITARKLKRRKRRFLHRAFTGIAVGGQLRLLTLTTSNEALDINIHQSWRKLLMRMRRRLSKFEYIGVREIDSRGACHLHILYRGDYVSQKMVSAFWSEIHLSPVVDIRLARGGRARLGLYLSKYLCKNVYNRFWCSYGWVFKGWLGWSKYIKWQTRGYPSRESILHLARCSKSFCAYELWRLERATIAEKICYLGIVPKLLDKAWYT